MDRFGVLLAARDWDAMRAACTPDAQVDDRRLTRNAGPLIANAQAVVEAAPDVRYERRLIGAAGGRVALERHLSVLGPAEAPAEIEYLCVVEVDAAGRIAGIVLFDVNDWRAANREARQRWFAVDPTAAAGVGPYAEYIEAANDNDRARLLALLADDLVVDDHRRTGMGHIEGIDAYAQSLTALTSLARDIEVNDGPSALAYARQGSVRLVRRRGTMAEGGGDFESDMIVVTVVAGGRIRRMELFEVEDVDAALARFEELRPDPLRIPPNAATRADDRRHDAWKRRDWDAVRALASPDFRFEDRSRRALVSGDVEMWVENQRFTRAGAVEREVIATAGDRIALQQILWTEGPETSPVEREHLRLTEVDTDGRIRASIRFDPDDRRAASAEMRERFWDGEGQCVPAAARDALRALVDHDFERLREVLPEDFVFHDHRRTGLGRLEGAAAFIQSLDPFAEQAPDFCIETLYTVALGEHGILDVARVWGTLAASGGAFDGCYARLGIWRGERIVSMELFEPEDLDRARACFASSPVKPPASEARR
jgi:ketosteroid isomerase-like protein